MFRHFLDLQSASPESRLTIDSVKAPPWVLVPIRTVGLTLPTTSSSPFSPVPQSSSSLLNSCSISSLTLSPRDVLMRPCWSINQNLDAAVDSSTLDSSWMASRNWRAMPSPADPAPNMTIRWSCSWSDQHGSLLAETSTHLCTSDFDGCLKCSKLHD
jgi:hypothetical protein